MVFEKVKNIILDQINVPEDKITLDANFVDDLGADSLDAVELLMSIEDEFELLVLDVDAKGMKTVGDIVKYIEAHI